MLQIPGISFAHWEAFTCFFDMEVATSVYGLSTELRPSPTPVQPSPFSPYVPHPSEPGPEGYHQTPAPVHPQQRPFFTKHRRANMMTGGLVNEAEKQQE
ncbi:uncharacterized [Tachysurus ichikawai]